MLAALAAGAGAGKQRHLVRRGVHHGRIGPEDVLRTVAVMNIKIDDCHAADAVFALGVTGGDRGVVEEAEAHRLRHLGVVAGRAHRDERILMLPGHDSVCRGHGTADPDSIGRSLSHGCIRLANWDVVRLATKIKAGDNVSIY